MIINLNDSYAVENSMCRIGEKPNENILEDSLFFTRFLDFVEKYDQVFAKQSLLSAKEWVSRRDYTSICYFLKPCINESFFNISYKELANTPVEILLKVQKNAQKIAPILDEQQALYEELMKAYKPAESSYNSSFSAWLDDDLEE